MPKKNLRGFCAVSMNDWAVYIDLTDAYQHILIHPKFRKYLWFMVKDQVFQFMALPFGMSLCRWIFTKLMDVIAAHLHYHTVLVFLYLDD